MTNTQAIKSLFPILAKKVYGKQMIYLDNAATTQKPQCVIDAITHYYTHMNANVHRGVHKLANSATQAVEKVRSKLQKLIHAQSSKEIVFTSGTTEAINLVTFTYGLMHLKKGDEILVSRLTHHSGFLPWQHLCVSKGAVIKEIPITKNGYVDIQAFSKLLSSRTKIVAINYVSNVLGTINPLKEIIALSHQYQAVVVVDASQAVAHFKIDVQDLDCDFLAFSSHKMYGPTGLGILYAKAKFLKKMPPYQLGGGMARTVDLEKTLYEDIPHRFEAGTLHIAGIVGFGAAIDFLVELGYEQVEKHEKDLLNYTQNRLDTLSHIRVLKTKGPKVGIVSFVTPHMHPLDVGVKLDAAGIQVRTGNHCAEPLMQYLGLKDRGVVRISLAIYNIYTDIDALVNCLSSLKKI